jgi:RES domain-containing protein
MLPLAQLKVALAKVNLISVHGPWSRAVPYRHLSGPPAGQTGKPQPLWGGAATYAGARFTRKGGAESLYLADNPITACVEVYGLVLLPKGPTMLRLPPMVLLSVEGAVSHVLDLTDSATLTALGTSEQEVTGLWVTSNNPPTQSLGQAAYDCGRISGIRYGSARVAGAHNLVVFPDALGLVATDYLQVYDSYHELEQRIGR